MDLGVMETGAVSRVLVLGAEREARHAVVCDLLRLCGQSTVPSDASQGVHGLTLTTKYYTAALELHVHGVEANELRTPLAHDADQYEALVWVVDAASDGSFAGAHQFVDNSIEELEFGVSLVVGTRAASANRVQLERLEHWAQQNAFEFVALEEEDAENQEEENPCHETRGMARVKEALECNMWASMVKPTLLGSASGSSAVQTSQPATAQVEEYDGAEEHDKIPASKILVLGADLAEQHAVVKPLVDLSNGHKIDVEGEAVQELKLTTKYYEADVELHLHRVETNELVTALQHDVEESEALLWVIDASSDCSFKEVQHFVERSIEELTFDVSLVVATHVDQASGAQVASLEGWCQENGFEFVGLSATQVSTGTVSSAEEEKRGIDRVLEALHCNMWRSMKMLPRDTESKPARPAAADAKPPAAPVLPSPISDISSPPPPPPTTAEEPRPHDARLETSLAALSGAVFGGDDDPDMEVFSGLFSQVQRIRESGAVLSDDERRRQAERVAMQLWNLLGASDDDDGDDDDVV